MTRIFFEASYSRPTAEAIFKEEDSLAGNLSSRESTFSNEGAFLGAFSFEEKKQVMLDESPV